MGMVEVHGAIDKEEDSRKKILVGRVRVSKWGWSRAMGPLKRKTTLVGRVRALSGDGRWPCDH